MYALKVTFLILMFSILVIVKIVFMYLLMGIAVTPSDLTFAMEMV